MPGITLIGIGPGTADQMTRQAWDVLKNAKEIWLRTSDHPAVRDLPPRAASYNFDDLYQASASIEDIHASIVRRILELARRPEGVLYAVPGHPLIAEATGAELLRIARVEGLRVEVMGGPSFIEPALAAFACGATPRLSLCDALCLGSNHVPPFPPDAPALISHVNTRLVAAAAKATLRAIYPDEHPAVLVHAAGTSEERVEDMSLSGIDRSEHLSGLTCLYIPPLDEGTSLEALQNVVAHLRAPEGCPWDREQTHASLRPHLLEETYETIEAIDAGSPEAMREEFGDLLLQIMLNAQIANEMGEFTLNEVAKAIHDKIIRRHPHVFGDVKVNGVDDVLTNWEKLKEQERGSRQKGGGLLDGVPGSLPALGQAQEYQERAARVGFDWPEVQGVLDKVAEEIREVQEVEGPEDLARELGDLIFALVNLARWKGVDAEAALRSTNRRFKSRFHHIENSAAAKSQRLSDLSLDEMERLWQEAKRSEGASPRH